MVEDPSGQRPHLTRRGFLVGAGAVAAGLTLYSSEVARHEIDITHISIPIDALPDRFVGLRIAQLSDIHLDEYTEPLFLERIVRRVDELGADLVLLTGDFVTRGSLTFAISHHAARRCAEILSTLKSERYAVLGNHDVSVSRTLVTSELEAHGIPVLRNTFTTLERGGDRLNICGTADPGTDIPDLNLALPAFPGTVSILMAHAPDYADNVVRHPRGNLVSLMLSGHSHGGQVRLPVLGPMVLPPLGRKYVAGLYRFDRMQLYVNRGIGTVGVPLRLNCPPEITVFTLKRAT